jgi:hypothetical protein
MDGVDITKAVINKGKQMASVAANAANGNGGRKKRKGTDLKPIVTNDAASPAIDPSATTTEGYASLLLFFSIVFAPVFFYTTEISYFFALFFSTLLYPFVRYPSAI